jgi:hypothetical protein
MPSTILNFLFERELKIVLPIIQGCDLRPPSWLSWIVSIFSKQIILIEIFGSFFFFFLKKINNNSIIAIEKATIIADSFSISIKGGKVILILYRVHFFEKFRLHEPFVATSSSPFFLKKSVPSFFFKDFVI